MSFIRSAFANAPMYSREQYAQWAIQEAKAAGFTDWRGAAVCCVMGMLQEAGSDPHDTGKQQIWNPGNHADPCYAAAPTDYPHDSEGNDGRSTGCLQQQMNLPGTTPWGWGGNYGDCVGTHKRMTPQIAIRMFYTWPGSGLKFKNMNASNADAANASVQRVQGSSFPNAYTKWWGEANALVDQIINNGGTPVPDNRPDFNEYPMWSPNSSGRSGTKVDLWLIHTQEGDGNADSLARYLQGHEVSYHYTISEDYNDHGVTVVDVVDTDDASWSVLSANPRSINLCFAGSRAAWSRNEWMRQSKAIDVAAYLAVQDCKKYGIATKVLAPPYNSNPPGISDHKYVTQWLKDGTHTDVGPNFPWDYFAQRVAFWAVDQPPPPPDPTPPPTDRQLLEQAVADTAWIRAQLGVGDPAWKPIGVDEANKPLTLRDAIRIIFKRGDK